VAVFFFFAAKKLFAQGGKGLLGGEAGGAGSPHPSGDGIKVLRGTLGDTGDTRSLQPTPAAV